jgi:hypothetical protein
MALHPSAPAFSIARLQTEYIHAHLDVHGRPGGWCRYPAEEAYNELRTGETDVRASHIVICKQ